MAYGSINEQLTAADMLGHCFWTHLQSGLPAGEALRRAKVQMVRDLQQGQGYLDGMDQKTLISFVLYGDPLAQPAQKSGALQKCPARHQSSRHGKDRMRSGWRD